MRLRVSFWFVVAAAAALLLVGAASVPLLDPDEARFARTSVEMLHSGDLVVPTFNGEPRLVKPPLLHWIQSFLFSVFGVQEWAARLAAALATLGSILLVAQIAHRRFGEEAALWGAAVLATMPLVFVLGHMGTLDALLAVHVLAVVTLDLTATERTDTYRALVMGGLLGLAFLVKGPVGVVLPLLVILAGRTAAGRNLLPSVGALSQGLAAWCLIVLPWGLAFLRRVGTGAALGTVRSEALERFFAGTAHVEPAWYYGKVVLVAFLPWLAPLLVALVRVWRMRKDPAARTAIYAAAGLLAGLLFFSLSKGKLPSYILPLAPLVAILVTWELGREIEAPRQRTLGPTLLAATVAATALLLGLIGGLRLEGAWRGVALAGAAIYGVGTVTSLYGAISRRPRWVYGSAALSMAVLLFVIAFQGFPAIGRERSTALLVEEVPELSSGHPVVTVEMRAPSLVFYLNRRVEVIEMRDLETRIGREDAATYVLADVDLSELPPEARERFREVGRRAKYRVFVPMPVAPESAPQAGPKLLDAPPGEK